MGCHCLLRSNTQIFLNTIRKFPCKWVALKNTITSAVWCHILTQTKTPVVFFFTQNLFYIINTYFNTMRKLNNVFKLLWNQFWAWEPSERISDIPGVCGQCSKNTIVCLDPLRIRAEITFTVKLGPQMWWHLHQEFSGHLGTSVLSCFRTFSFSPLKPPHCNCHQMNKYNRERLNKILFQIIGVGG